MNSIRIILLFWIVFFMIGIGCLWWSVEHQPAQALVTRHCLDGRMHVMVNGQLRELFEDASGTKIECDEA